MINSMILDIVKNTHYNLKNLRPKKIIDIYNADALKFDFNQLKTVKSKEYVKKITV